MAEPKKEAVRSVLPRTTDTIQGSQPLSAGLESLRIVEPVVPAPVSVKKTQSPVAESEIARISPVMVASSREIGGFDSIPRWFCWGLLSISTFIFLIQIWNYTLS